MKSVSKNNIRWLMMMILGLSTSSLHAQISFESHDQYDIGDTPYALKAGDFNNDGFMEIWSQGIYQFGK